MSYYSASMSWDHTRLTSSKVVVHNTCSTGTVIDRSEVYRYHRYRYHHVHLSLSNFARKSLALSH